MVVLLALVILCELVAHPAALAGGNGQAPLHKFTQLTSRLIHRLIPIL
ncbi:hypothetical protein HMPREF1978_00216 [Actinomyces graevenitzii F0530]|uniref:CNNM transmembrane domain-containing protein n=1 Tax=Actinomyces graevenitzii F0530 TaxID=1321817 RepID=U1RJB0_9ACTO|nr:hypothetical protein HMPREF1978_00216 [Actinomyces graevenitzii F0530]